MVQLAISIVFSLVFLTACVTAQEPPSNLPKFESILRKAKLQSPTSGDVTFNLIGYATENFQLVPGEFMQFRMSGKGRRTELRQMRSEKVEAWWSVTGSQRMRARVALPTPEAEMELFTFLQTLCVNSAGSHVQAMAVTWNRDFDEGMSDVISASVAFNDSPDSRQSFYLTGRNVAIREFIIDIEDSRLNIWHEGNHVLQNIDLSWFNDHNCYYKAGVYVHEPDDISIYARTKFSELEW